jgi:hypothetical protein
MSSTALIIVPPLPEFYQFRKELTMRSCHLVAVLTLWTVITGTAVLGGGEKGQPKDAPKEETVAAYDSATHGALHVKAASAKSTEWFMAFQNDKQLAPPGKPALNTTVELAPGSYVVHVNRTQRKVTIQVGKQTTLLAGELVVEAKKGTPGWYTPFQGKEAMLADNPPVLNSPIALFAGKYRVSYREGGTSKPQDMGEAEVKAGQTTVLKR